MEEHFFQCPYCWETISMMFDTAVEHQEYIEDCEVCCHPIKILVTFNNSQLISLEAVNIE